jgi:hypothetical protein
MDQLENTDWSRILLVQLVKEIYAFVQVQFLLPHSHEAAMGSYTEPFE